jgi:hypothetical protein
VEKTLLNGMLSSVSKTPENLMCPEIAKQIGKLAYKSPQLVLEELDNILEFNRLSNYCKLIITTARDMAVADINDMSV